MFDLCISKYDADAASACPMTMMIVKHIWLLDYKLLFFFRAHNIRQVPWLVSMNSNRNIFSHVASRKKKKIKIKIIWKCIISFQPRFTNINQRATTLQSFIKMPHEKELFRRIGATMRSMNSILKHSILFIQLINKFNKSLSLCVVFLFGPLNDSGDFLPHTNRKPCQ